MRRWISATYSPKRVAIGVSGGSAHFFITHPDGTPEELKQDGLTVAQALNTSEVGQKLLAELTGAPAPQLPRPLFVFSSFDQWCDKAASWFKTSGVRGDQIVLLDTKGRICQVGADCMRARDEDAFPLSAYHYRNLVATASDNTEFEGPTPEAKAAAMERTLRKRMGGEG